MNKEKRKLSDVRPDLLKEWDYEKNSLICSPDEITIGSNKKVWWKCQKGHSYQQTPNKRISKGCNCPYCSGRRVLTGFNDLATLNPELMKEWDFEKNEVDPSKVSLHSNIKVWWKCSTCGHEWKVQINDRSNGRSCPICARKVRAKSFREYYLKRGENDLATIRPDLLKEWDYEKNKDILPGDFTCYSKEKVWWKCSVCGNEWQATITNRANNNSGCPRCMKHERTSFPEQAILYYVQQVYPDAINSYTDIFPDITELDIYIPSINTGIEYDGVVWHSSQRAVMKAKQKYDACKKNGIRLIRISESSNNNAYNDDFIYRDDLSDAGLDECIIDLLQMISAKAISVDSGRDRNEIHSRYITCIKNKSIASRCPELAIEWDYEKNKGITPIMVNSVSNIKYWWICPKGHSYSASPANRSHNHTGCPYCCNNKVLSGFNDLETRYPDIAKEWDYEKNNLKPSEVLAGSAKKYWWKCDKGHSYEMKPNDRIYRNAGCLFCSGHKVLQGFNDIATTNPDIIAIWDYEKNSIKPEQVSSGSNQVVWWKCDKGHSWKKRIASQINHNYCPICKGRKVQEGVNDLCTLYPNIAKDWDYEKNTIRPSEITKTFDEYVWWKCSECGHEWKQTVALRVRTGIGCPKCGYSKKMQKTIENNVVKSKRDLVSRFPEIAKEWDYVKNGDLDPGRVSYGANRKVWWICPKGHSYQARITDRTGKHHSGCPICSGKRKAV